jgi:hypothetical protein
LLFFLIDPQRKKIVPTKGRQRYLPPSAGMRAASYAGRLALWAAIADFDGNAPVTARNSLPKRSGDTKLSASRRLKCDEPMEEGCL